MKKYQAFFSPDMDKHQKVVEKISRDLTKELDRLFKQQMVDLMRHSPQGMPRNLLIGVLVTITQTVIQQTVWAYLGCGFLGSLSDKEKGQILQQLENQLLKTIPQVLEFQADKIFTRGK